MSEAERQRRAAERRRCRDWQSGLAHSHAELAEADSVFWRQQSYAERLAASFALSQEAWSLQVVSPGIDFSIYGVRRHGSP
ncbi:MAG: hypothetical protein ACPGUV_03055 [Polyangiales bacterium]